MIDHETDRIIKTIARKYKRKCRWRSDVDVDDLVQEGYVAALLAKKNFRAEKGELSHYTSCAVRRAIANYLILSGSPVSEAWHERYSLCGLQKTSFDTLAAPQEGQKRAVHSATIDPRPSIEERLAHERARVAIAGRLREIFGEDEDELLEALLDEQTEDEFCPPRKSLATASKLMRAKERIREELVEDGFVRDWRKAG